MNYQENKKHSYLKNMEDVAAFYHLNKQRIKHKIETWRNDEPIPSEYHVSVEELRNNVDYLAHLQRHR